MNLAAEETLDIERSGGFGGLTLHASVDMHTLEPRERAAVEECFRRPSTPPSGPDRFVYRLRVNGREAYVQEDRVPPDLWPVLDGLSWT